MVGVTHPSTYGQVEEGRQGDMTSNRNQDLEAMITEIQVMIEEFVQKVSEEMYAFFDLALKSRFMKWFAFFNLVWMSLGVAFIACIGLWLMFTAPMANISAIIACVVSSGLCAYLLKKSWDEEKEYRKSIENN